MSHHIIFDLDGTIIDSKGEIVKTYHEVFDRIVPGEKPDFASINHGATLTHTMTQIYGEATDKIKEAKAFFSQIYDQSDYSETTIYGGVVDTLKSLKTLGHQLYIATNKRLAPTLRILAQKNLAAYFADVVTTDCKPSIVLQKHDMIRELKHRHSFSNGFMIGDMTSDIIAGNGEQMKTIAVTYGYGTRNDLIACNPGHIIDNPRGILEVL